MIYFTWLKTHRIHISDVSYLYSSLQTELSKQRELLEAVVLHQVVWTGAVTKTNDSYSLSCCITNKYEIRTNKKTLCPHPRQSEMLYVSTASWQTRFHSSAPVSVLQGVLSEAPAARPRRLDFFLVSSPTGAGMKWGTKRQQRK